MKKLIALSAVVVTTSVFAGNGGGTGTPPAIKDEMSMLMSSDNELLSVVSDNDLPLLLSKKELPPSMLVSMQSLTTSSDPSLLTKFKTIEALQLGTGFTKTYEIKDGDQLGSFELIDKRTKLRNSVLGNIPAE